MNRVEWDQAARVTVLEDLDTFADWLQGKCIGVHYPSDGNMERIARHLIVGQQQPADVPDLLGLMLLNDDPAIQLGALNMLRKHYIDEQSVRVAEVAWKAQDDATLRARNDELNRQIAAIGRAT